MAENCLYSLQLQSAQHYLSSLSHSKKTKANFFFKKSSPLNVHSLRAYRSPGRLSILWLLKASCTSNQADPSKVSPDDVFSSSITFDTDLSQLPVTGVGLDLEMLLIWPQRPGYYVTSCQMSAVCVIEGSQGLTVRWHTAVWNTVNWTAEASAARGKALLEEGEQGLQRRQCTTIETNWRTTNAHMYTYTGFISMLIWMQMQQIFLI